ncbi:MAG: LysR family transcriptional regulator [Oscillospiraceae bacterium]
MQKLAYRLKITLTGEENFFGPGIVEILQRTEQSGSLHGACAEMHMAYSKAWRVLKKAEKELGFALLEGKAGGAHGGKSTVTPKAKAFCKRYEDFCTEINSAAQKAFINFTKTGEENERD